MSSRAEVEQAFRIITDADYYSRLVLDPETRVCFDRKNSFKQFLDKNIERIGSARWRTWMSNVRFASRNILAYWSDVVGDIFLAHEASVRGSKDYEEYDGRWTKVGDEELRLTVEKIEGAVDVTRYRVQRRTPSEKSEIVFDLDEQGRLEESLNPLRITNQSRASSVDDDRIEHKVEYRHGTIERIVETVGSGGDMPAVIKTTEFRFTSLI